MPSLRSAQSRRRGATYRRQEQNAKLLDFKCVEFVEELPYGKYRKHPLNQ
jgi:hypothetical protein